MAVEEGTHAEAPLHAVAAEFDSPAMLLDAVRAMHGRRLGRIDAHSPVPIVGMADALGLGPSLMTLFAVGGVVLGFAASMTMCVYATAYDYPFNIGGRPTISWPAFVVPSFSFAMMVGALIVYFGMLFLNRLPRLNHPAFNIPDFHRVTQDRYILTVEEQDHPLDPGAVEDALAALPGKPLSVTRVPR